MINETLNLNLRGGATARIVPAPMEEQQEKIFLDSEEPLDKGEDSGYSQRRKLKSLKNYNIQINFMDRGCVIQVGCKSIAFESVEQAMVELLDYSKDPEKVQEKWLREFGKY
jgi:Fe-S-cluster formation regulator IscX/YfhJ